jgi:hypothetical protein
MTPATNGLGSPAPATAPAFLTSDFLKLLVPPDADGYIELRILKPYAFSTFVRADDPAAMKKVRDWVNQHIFTRDLYVGVAERRTNANGKIENCAAFRVLYAEIDFKDVPEDKARRKLAEFALPPSVIVHSGGGFHVYWLLREPARLNEDGVAGRVRGAIRWLRNELDGDPDALDLARILRVPNTVNHKYPHKPRVTIELMEPTRRYALDDFGMAVKPDTASGEPREAPEPSTVVDAEKAVDLLASTFPAVGLGVHAYILRLAGWFAHNGVSLADAESILGQADGRACNGTPRDYETLRAVRDTYKRFAGGGTVEGLPHALPMSATLEADVPAIAAALGMGSRESASGGVATAETSERDAGPDTEWPVLQPLPDALPPAPPLTRDMLPPGLAGFVFDIAHRMSCAVDYPAVSTVVGLATVVGRKVVIRPKKHDSWTVVPNLWGLIIGPPGVLKTPAQHAAFRFLYALADQARERHEGRMKAHAVEVMRYEAEMAQLKDEEKAAKKDAAALAEIKERMDALHKPEEPKAERYITNDATVEKLGQMLVTNTNGLLIERDEMTGLFAQMEAKGHEQDRSFYLEAWDGHRGKAIDRIGRGSLWVPHCVLSMIGTIQPGPLAAHLDDFYGEGRTDGFIERFQLAVYPEVPEWTDVDEAPDQAAVDAAEAVFTRAHALVGDPLGGPLELVFDPSAQAIFTRWRAGLERRVRDEEMHPVLRSHLAKYRSLMPSLALLFQIALDKTITTVQEEPTRLAIRWCEYLEGHARRMLWPVIQEESTTAVLRLARRLRGMASGAVAVAVGEEFTARDLAKNEWSGLKDPGVIVGALRELEALGWVRGRGVAFGRGGRETVKWTVNPAVGTPGHRRSLPVLPVPVGGNPPQSGIAVRRQGETPFSPPPRHEFTMLLGSTPTGNTGSDRADHGRGLPRPGVTTEGATFCSTCKRFVCICSAAISQAAPLAPTQPGANGGGP